MSDTFGPAGGDGPDRWAVRLVRRYPHPVERVWRAVTEPEHLAVWFPSTVEIEPVVGAEVRFGAPMEGRPELTGRVTDCDPPHLIAFTWDTDHLRFELTATDDGTELVLLHTFDDRAGAASFASGWDTCLGALQCDLAGEPVPEPDRAAARHEELVAVFGLDAPAVDEVDPAGRWRIVFERQMVAPADVVRTLLGPAPEVAFADGTGHGARVVVTLTGTDPTELDDARTRWHRRIEDAAAGALAAAP